MDLDHPEPVVATFGKNRISFPDGSSIEDVINKKCVRCVLYRSKCEGPAQEELGIFATASRELSKNELHDSAICLRERRI